MSQPPVYNRSSSFSSLQALAPTTPLSGPLIDAEYNNVKTTLDAVLANLALIQRDDGALANASVGLNQLSSQVTVGFSVPTAWTTGYGYVSSPASTVFNGGKFYSCLVSHTSGTFATDLAAAKWVLIADLTAIPLVAANQIAVTASGLLTTDVQGSLQALDAGKAATSHTHVASAISDSTAAGRAMLTAATVAAQQTLLGLGAQAYVNNVLVTAIGAQLALTGVISPAALVADINDWSPTGWATATRVRLSATSAIHITGLLATSDGDIKILENIGATNALILTAEDAGSAAANRITVVGNLVLDPGQACILMYGATSARWRVLAGGMTTATSAQATALTDAAAAITPATAQAAVNAAIPVFITANPTTNPFGLQKLHVREQQTSGTAGGTFTSGSWVTRTLNTVVTNQISGASLASNQITLPAGTYDIDASAPGAVVALHKAKLKNITDSSDAVVGTSENSQATISTTSRSVVRGRFTIAAQKVFELQHQCSATRAPDGLGLASSFSVVEVYSEVVIWKVA